MKNLKCLYSILTIVFVLACLYTAASGQTTEDKSRLATINGNGSSARWDVAVPNAGLTLIVSAPDGRVFSKNFKGGSSPNFSIADAQGERLPDGQYTYELRLTSGSSPARKDVTSNGRGKDDEPEAVRAARKSVVPVQSVVESGSFSVVNGSVVVAGSQEESAPRSASKSSALPQAPEMTLSGRVSRKLHHTPFMFMPDDVIPDDLIVQGSACVGLDCVNGEVFGFDTVRLKENNTRLQFDDTSTAAGFPTNNWQIRANSSASGGASFLGFVDQGASGNSETGTVVFEVDAGAPANALKVSSTGRVGLRTATPVLDLHITTSDTPAHRLEQTAAGGFTAQTWDIAGNEANFFVRDVTGGSRLPFRIRPGAPTSSIDINASGNVGVGTASPELRVDARVANTATDFTNNVTYAAGFGNVSGKRVTIGYDETGEDIGLIQSVHTLVGFKNLSLNPNGGNVGIGTVAPTALLSVNGTANKPGGGSWDVFSDERLKNIKGNFNSGLKAVMQLQPLRYEYKQNNALGIHSDGEHVGFGAQAVQKIIPEAVTSNSQGYLQINNDPILWTMLNAIKEQQKEIEQLKGQIRQLRAAHKRR
ncbi:MAG TPA: tail fiber domain-containing protein [Pyrinomonadaceae bacterium]